VINEEKRPLRNLDRLNNNKPDDIKVFNCRIYTN